MRVHETDNLILVAGRLRIGNVCLQTHVSMTLREEHEGRYRNKTPDAARTCCQKLLERLSAGNPVWTSLIDVIQGGGCTLWKVRGDSWVLKCNVDQVDALVLVDEVVSHAGKHRTVQAT